MAIANVPITSLPEATSPSANDYLILQGKSTQKIKWSVLLDKLYPVGCIYQSASSTSPASFLGGTWEQIKDRFILAAGDTYAAGSTGGEATHTLTVNEMPRHNHDHVMWYRDQKFGLNGRGGDVGSLRLEFSSADCTDGICTDFKGDSQPHNNLPPYLTAYIWRRIA
jgi:hypothetical protein